MRAMLICGKCGHGRATDVVGCSACGSRDYKEVKCTCPYKTNPLDRTDVIRAENRAECPIHKGLVKF